MIFTFYVMIVISHVNKQTLLVPTFELLSYDLILSKFS